MTTTQYFRSLTQHELIDIVKATQKNLFLCLPAIHEELAEAIIHLAESNSHNVMQIDIQLIIDFDSQTFRQGYGDFRSIENLIKRNIPIQSLPDNRISFIISDGTGYYLFIESRSLIPADKKTINAIRIDPVSLVRLKKFFFGLVTKIDFEDELTNAIIDESIQLEKANDLLSSQIAPVIPILGSKLKDVAEDLQQNPPLNPDYKRIVEFYSNKFQYVKLKFEGSKLQYKKIEIPTKALPIADATLKKRLEAKLNLFDKQDYEVVFAPLMAIKEDVEELRGRYLTKVKSREESLLNKLQKQNFESEVTLLKAKLSATQQQLMTGIAKLINGTKNNLLDELIDFFKENPKTLFAGYPNLWQDDPDYLDVYAETKAHEIIYRIKWPDAHFLVNEFNLEVQYSDITFESLKNQQFIEELSACGLINANDENQLAEFSRGIHTN